MERTNASVKSSNLVIGLRYIADTGGVVATPSNRPVTNDNALAELVRGRSVDHRLTDEH